MFGLYLTILCVTAAMPANTPRTYTYIAPLPCSLRFFPAGACCKCAISPWCCISVLGSGVNGRGRKARPEQQRGEYLRSRWGPFLILMGRLWEWVK